MKRRTPHDDWLEALRWVAADPRGRRFLGDLVKPMFDAPVADGDAFDVGRRYVAHRIWDAFVAEAPGQITSLLTEVYRGQQSGRRRPAADDGDDGADRSDAYPVTISRDTYL